MIGSMIWCVTIFGCALLFIGIGIYAARLEKPMWFWSGSTVDPETITNVKQYNWENARMWGLYSLWYWVAGFLWFWRPIAAVAFLTVGATLGTGLLVHAYLKIEKRYKKNCL